jgi:hypothetical protein
MTKGTRFFLIGSSLILVVGLCTGLVAYYNGGLPMFSARRGPADLVYVSADASAVAFADVRQIMDSEFRQKVRQILPTGEEKDRLLAETGIDLEHDIDTVVAGFTGSAQADHGAIALVRGRFNNGQIEALATQHGGTVEEYKGKRLVLIGEFPSPDVASVMPGGAAVSSHVVGCLGFLETGLIALGDAAAVKHAVDVRASGESVTKNDDVMKFVADVDSTSNAWIFGRVDAVQGVASLPQQITDQMSTVQWLSLSARVDGGVSGQFRAEARDEAAGENLRAVVNGGLAAARLMAGKDPKVDAVLNSLQMSGTGKTVAVSFTVSPEVLDLLNGVAGLANLKGGK